MREFYLLFGLIVSIGLSVFFVSCNESTVDPDLYGMVSGTIKTSEGGLPLEGVSITTSPGTSAVTTNADGYFSLGKILIGDYSVTAKKENYTSESISIKVQDGQEVVMEIIMKVAPLETTIPDEPVYVSPLDASLSLPPNVDLVWNLGETAKGDTLRYDVILYQGGDDFLGSKVASNLLDTTFTLTGLSFETSYRWKVVARNRSLDETEGREWKFRTENFPKNGFLFVKDTLGSKDIYSWDLAANHLVRLTNNGGSEIYPRISPNKERIAYSSNESSEYHIYTMDTKGGNVFQVTSGKSVEGNNSNGKCFTWSPDGDQLLYGHMEDLYVVNYNAAGNSTDIIAKAPVNRNFGDCDWCDHFNNSPQEKIVVLTQGVKPYDNEIYLMDPDGKNMDLLVGNLKGTLSSPRFSPDGVNVIFSLDTLYEDDNGRQLNARIYSINVDGSNLIDLSGDEKENGTNDLQARYSETGGKIIFMNIVASKNGEGIRSIWTMDTDGQNREKLITNAEMPEWYVPKDK